MEHTELVNNDMVNYRIESLAWFAATGRITSSMTAFIVSGFDVFPPCVFTGFSILFSGIWGYASGHYFGLINVKSYYLAMLSGAGITSLAVVTTAIASSYTITLILEHLATTANTSKTNTDAVLFAGLSIIFSASIAIPAGALTGYFIHKPCDDEKHDE